MKYTKHELEKLNLFTDPDWFELLLPFLTTEEFARITNTIRLEKEKGIVIYPKVSQIFRAFNEVKLKDVRVIVQGLDPYNNTYRNNPNACGLSFSVERESDFPPSLEQIYKAIENDVYHGLDVNEFPRGTGDLTYLCKQGVLLLNSALTVQEGISKSHIELWKPFMNYTIEALQSVKKELIFLLWGEEAKRYTEIISPFTHYILEASHPASAAYKGSIWKTNNFSRVNSIIKINDLGLPIHW